jgi:hypothetical protein
MSAVDMATITKYWPKFRDYAPHCAVMLLNIALGCLSGFFTGRVSGARVAGDAKWSLPAWNAYQKADAAKIDDAAAVFFSDAPSRKTVKAAPVDLKAWRFVGTVKEGGQIKAVLMVGQPPRVVHVEEGGRLPNGEQISAIEDGLIRYVDESGPRELHLVKKDEK